MRSFCRIAGITVEIWIRCSHFASVIIGSVHHRVRGILLNEIAQWHRCSPKERAFELQRFILVVLPASRCILVDEMGTPVAEIRLLSKFICLFPPCSKLFAGGSVLIVKFN